MANLTEFFKTTKYLLDGGSITVEPRPYLGMSQLGHPCDRYLWLSFRWAYVEEVPPRLIRLWARGHREEPVVYEMLREKGYKLSEDDAQMEFVSSLGHVKGHCDGIVSNVVEAPKTPHILEIKTANDAKFKQFKKHNNLAKVHPIYYAQVQLYMGFSKLTRALWIVINKNDDDIHVERIRFNRAEFDDYVRKGDRIVLAQVPPIRPFIRTHYLCKMCAAKDVCFGKSQPAMNCRICGHIALQPEGKWFCDKKQTTLDEEAQRQGCSDFISIGID